MKALKFPNVYIDRNNLYTRMLYPDARHFDEKTVTFDGKLFRLWDPKRSKLCAALQNQISQIGIKDQDVVLYLGASHGYTPSFVSDMVGKGGFVFALDFAPRVVRDLVFVCEKRKNIAPILGDANHPESYADKVCEADIVYQDVAQKNQVDIFLKNCEFYLKKSGFGLLALKARSIDVSKKPREIFKAVRARLNTEMIVADYRTLDPFERDHAFLVCKKS